MPNNFLLVMVKERKSKMPFLNRWNYETQEYDPYGVPDDWNIKSYSDDMDEIVNCPHCGKEVTFGSCYTSKEIHTPHGFGYAVCEKCYDMERTRENNYETFVNDLMSDPNNKIVLDSGQYLKDVV